MKLTDIQIHLNEDLRRNKDDVKDAISLVRDAYSETNATGKAQLEKALDKLRAVRDDMPKSDFDYFKKIIGKILTLPLRIFTI
jgi:hypothetical protein